MTLPNKLTLFRIILIPIMVVFYYHDPFSNAMVGNTSALYILLGSIFVVGSVTDFLDGYLARKWNQITTFGKFMDPLADKILVVSTLLLMLDAGDIPAWVLIIIITREFAISGIRLVAAAEGTVIAASNLGKYKTASTMIAIIMMLYFPTFALGWYLMLLATGLTILSGVDYIKKNVHIILASK